MSRDFQLAWPFDLPKMGVYAIVCEDGRSYVGQSRRIRGRWKDHLKELKAGRGSSRLQEAWDLHGPAGFEFKVLEVVTDPLLLQAREQHHIDLMQAHTTGLNTLPTAGSFRGYTPDAKARAKIGAASRKRLQDNPDQQPAMVAASKASGYNPTEEHVSRIAEAHRGVPKGPMSEDHRQAISRALAGKAPLAAIAAKTGSSLSEETKRRIGDGNRGKKRTPEQLAQRANQITASHKASISRAMKGRPWSKARRDAHEARKVVSS